jgi:hypothetical protein
MWNCWYLNAVIWFFSPVQCMWNKLIVLYIVDCRNIGC